MHTFALFVENFISNKDGSLLKIKDQAVIHRTLHVLRIKESEEVIIFDKKNVYELKLDSISKKEITFNVSQVLSINYSKARHVCLLPLIDREYMEKALYSCAQSCIKDVYVVRYDKSQSKWGLYDRDWQRAQAMLIAGCEQSKQFIVPKLHKGIISLSEVFNRFKDRLLVCRENENPLFNQVDKLKIFSQECDIAFTCGPEAGFSKEEKKQFDLVPLSIGLGSSVFRSADVIQYMSYTLHMI